MNKNAEGYNDPTANKAMTKVIREERELQRRVDLLIGVMRNIAELAGFDLVARIAVKDRKSGREFR
jgi:hypothetical protein